MMATGKLIATLVNGKRHRALIEKGYRAHHLAGDIVYLEQRTEVEMPEKLNHLPNPLPCGCAAVRIQNADGFEVTIADKKSGVRFCPLHQAAGELRKALREAITRLKATDHMPWCSHGETDCGCACGLTAVLESCESAIAKATTPPAEAPAAGAPRR